MKKTSAKHQYLTIGDFLAWDEKQGVQIKTGSINDTAHTIDDAQKQLAEQWEWFEGKGHKDVRFFGVVYKAEVIKLYA